MIENKAELAKFIKMFAELEGRKILVHGGGKKASEVLAKMGIEPKMVGGRRITDAESLEIIVMVYGGLTNKEIVAQLQAQNCNAIGLSGADGDTIRAHKRPVKEIDYGFAGDIDGIGAETVSSLLQAGLVPVFCALTHDGKGQLLNTNADTIASEIAIGLSQKYQATLYYCFEKKGVLTDINNADSVIETIDTESYRSLVANKVIADGMLPKLQNCFHALNQNVYKVCIGDISMLNGKTSVYTTITL